MQMKAMEKSSWVSKSLKDTDKLTNYIINKIDSFDLCSRIDYNDRYLIFLDKDALQVQVKVYPLYQQGLFALISLGVLTVLSHGVSVTYEHKDIEVGIVNSWKLHRAAVKRLARVEKDMEDSVLNKAINYIEGS